MSRGRPTRQASPLQVLVVVVVVVVVARFGWLGVLGLAVAYAIVCRFWPVATCGKCQGSGKCFQPGSNVAHRTCPRCGGRGVHVRLLASIWHSGDD